jgi:lipid-binding SYLF domain-containing protein
MTNTRRIFLALALSSAAALPLTMSTVVSANAATADDLNRDATQALQSLYKTNPVANQISKQARAVLVFPKIVKAGLIFGGAYGEGVLQQGPKVVNYYNSFSGSWGLQAGAQSYGYVVFLMNTKAMDYIDKSNGWEVGVGPTVVIVNEGVAKNLSTSTLKDDAYAFIFDQEGLMAGVSIEGTKISKIRR